MQNVDNILKLLPGSWDEMTLRQFQKLNPDKFLDAASKQPDEIEDMFTTAHSGLDVIAKLADVPIKELEEMSMASLTKLLHKVSFTEAEPVKKWKSSIKWKQLDEITYDNYVSYMNLAKQPMQNLHTIIKIFAKNDLTEEQVQELPMSDVHTGFFASQNVEEINKNYVQKISHDTPLEQDKGSVEQHNPFQEEKERTSQKLKEAYGFQFLAKDVADYANCSIFEILDKPAVVVFYLAITIQASETIRKSNKSNA